jgi:carbonic anhydrase/acetyltransferase-like protein (isoleucine patch superfamily)
MIRAFKDKSPQYDPATVFIEDSAQVIGDVTIGPHSSVWFNATVRADIHYIRIGTCTNLQDNTVVHVTNDEYPTVLEDYITVGHSVTIHGCHIRSNCLIGIGSIILDGAFIEEGSVIAAGALVAPGTVVGARSLMMGIPARRVREVTDEELAKIREAAEHYVEYKNTYMKLYGR